MRWKVILALALGLNCVLAFAALSQRKSRPTPKVAVREIQISSATRWITNVITETNVVHAEFFWSEIESADYAQYVTNLRGIGCPEETIRDILTAELNLVFDARAMALADAPSRQFWELLLDSKMFENLVRDRYPQLTGLRKERDLLLKSLLGDETPKDTTGD